MDDDENLQCCGSGCTNCVLDRELNKPKTVKGDFENVISYKYTTFELTSIERCTFNIYELCFMWKDDLTQNSGGKKPILRIPGGSYLMWRAPKDVHDLPVNPIYEDYHKTLQEIPKDPKFQETLLEKHDTTEEDLFISRPYTPVLVDEENCLFKVLLKLEPFGRMSNYILSLQVGALTEWKGVYNTIPPSIKSAFSHVICFSHGVSIAPFYTLSKELTEDEAFESNIHLYACFKDIDSILLRDKLVKLNGYWNFKSTIILSREHHQCCCKLITTGTVSCNCAKARQKFSETLLFGRIDRKFLQESIPRSETLVLLCGSQSFTSQIEAHLCDNKNLQIHTL